MNGQSSVQQFIDAYQQRAFNPRTIGTTQARGAFTLPPSLSKAYTNVFRFQAGAPQTPILAGELGRRDSIVIDGDSLFLSQKIARYSSAVDEEGGLLGPALDDTVTFETTPQTEQMTFPKIYLSGLGSGSFPKVVAPPYQIPRNAVFSAVVDSRSLLGYTSNTVLIAHHGAKVYRQAIRPAMSYVRSRWFVYNCAFNGWDGTAGNGGTIAASATKIGMARMDSDSDFMVQAIAVLSETPIAIQIETGPNDQWSNVPVDFRLYGGTNPQAPGADEPWTSGEWPCILTAERWIMRGTVITVRATNLDPDVATNASVLFYGQRCYPADLSY